MGKQDDYQSQFFENKNRFADLYNGCLFGGKDIMKAEDLEEADSVIVSSSENSTTIKVIADKIRKWKGYHVSILILESQSYIDYQMVLRSMKDDLANYEKQRKQAYQDLLDSGLKPSNYELLSKAPKDLKLVPCITLILYLGTDEPWDAKTELYQLLDIDEELKPYVSNYKLNLFDFHNHEDFSVFKTDIRYLFESLSKASNKKELYNYIETVPLQNSTDLDVIQAILGCIGRPMSKKDLEKLQNKENGGRDMMCKALRDMIDDGILEGTIRTLFNLINDGIINLTTAANQASVSEERFMELVEQFQLNTNRDS